MTNLPVRNRIAYACVDHYHYPTIMRISPADCAIFAFGSIRKTARVVGKTPGAVGFWRKNGTIPAESMAVILVYAKDHGLHLSAEDLILGRK